jgi:hypothetical protein
VNARVLAIALIVGGLIATAAGLGVRQLVSEDEGHHDGRSATFALSTESGIHELTVESAERAAGDRVAPLRVAIERAGQPITAHDEVHGAPMHVFVVSTELDWFLHVDPPASPDGASFHVDVPAGRTYRIITHSAPAGGPDLLELATDVALDALAEGPTDEPPFIATDDVWTTDSMTIRRQGFDFTLSQPWSGR